MTQGRLQTSSEKTKQDKNKSASGREPRTLGKTKASQGEKKDVVAAELVVHVVCPCGTLRTIDKVI